MTEEMQQILNRKLERRKQLAALPVGEKLRLLEEMVAATKVISASRPPAPAHEVLLHRSVDAKGRKT
jgi:hypothetical protein